MTLYLSLADDALASVLSALSLYQDQISKGSLERDVHIISRAIVHLHIGLEKAFKHRLGAIDEALPISGLEGSLLQKLRKLQLEQQSPSLLAVRTRIDTHGLVGLLHILNTIVSPVLPAGIFDQFVQHCSDLAALRNQIVHAELFGDSDELLAVITRVLSRLRAILGAMDQTFLDRLRKENDHLDPYLVGIENEIDGAWQVLIDHLKHEGPTGFPFKAFVTLPFEGANLQVLLSSAEFLGSSLTVRATISPDSATGFFARSIGPGEARFWEHASKLAAPQSLLPGGLLGYLIQQSVPETLNVGSKGLLPTEAGSFRLAAVPGRIFLNLRNRKPSFLSANLRVENLSVTFEGQQEEGKIQGTLSSGAVLTGTVKAGRLNLQGSAWFDAEYVYGQPVEDAPAGTTVRTLKGSLILAHV